MYAHNYGNRFFHTGPLRYVELHLLKDPIVKVKVAIANNGDYYGWIRKDEEIPTMIWPSLVQFSMCFPYGYETEEKVNKGKMVRLQITAYTHPE